MSKIKYKVLEKPLKMLFKVEVSEKTTVKEDFAVRLFEIDIVPQKTSFWSGSQNIELIRTPSALSGIPANNVDAFAQQVAAVLHNLTFKMSDYGMPLRVEKQDELWQKWLAVRANLADSYAGEWVDKSLSLVDQKMLPSEKLTRNLMQDLFLNEYFRGAYGVQFSDNSFKRERTVYGLCPFPIQFNETWTLQSLENEQRINFFGKWNGIVNTDSFKQWLQAKTGTGIAQITVDGYYQISNYTGWCNALYSSYLLTAGNGYEKNIKVTLTTN